MQTHTPKALRYLQEKLSTVASGKVPDIHIVLGSGFGEALRKLPASWQLLGEIPFASVPGLVASTVPDHAGQYRLYKSPSGKIVMFQQGRLHGYEGHPANQVVQPVMLPRQLGVKHFVLTNAAGGLLKSMQAGDVMIITDHVNMTGKNPLVGENPKSPSGHELGPRFPDMCNIYNQDLRNQLKQILLNKKIRHHEGIYIGVLGPSFETPAEINLFAQWGMGAVGMSTVWEAIALKHSGASVVGLSLISNLGAGLVEQSLDHLEIIKTSRESAEKIVQTLTDLIENGAFA